MELYEVEVFIRDIESGIVKRKVGRDWYITPGEKIEVWVNDHLKFEEEHGE